MIDFPFSDCSSKPVHCGQRLRFIEQAVAVLQREVEGHGPHLCKVETAYKVGKFIIHSLAQEESTWHGCVDWLWQNEFKPRYKIKCLGEERDHKAGDVFFKRGKSQMRLDTLPSRPSRLLRTLSRRMGDSTSDLDVLLPSISRLTYCIPCVPCTSSVGFLTPRTLKAMMFV